MCVLVDVFSCMQMCLREFRGQRLMISVFFNFFMIFFFFETESLTEPGTHQLARVTDHFTEPAVFLPFASARLQVCTTGSRDLNSDSHTCTAGSLLTKPFPACVSSFKIKLFKISNYKLTINGCVCVCVCLHIISYI